MPRFPSTRENRTGDRHVVIQPLVGASNNQLFMLANQTLSAETQLKRIVIGSNMVSMLSPQLFICKRSSLYIPDTNV